MSQILDTGTLLVLQEEEMQNMQRNAKKCQNLQHLCLSHLYPCSNSVCSVTSGSPHSQEGNLDTEVLFQYN